MTVYVDDYQKPARVGRLNRRWSHLFVGPTDDPDELHTFAQAIGLRRAWFQPKSYPHYDVTDSMRVKAINHGAVSITARAGAFMRWKERKDNECQIDRD